MAVQRQSGLVVGSVSLAVAIGMLLSGPAPAADKTNALEPPVIVRAKAAVLRTLPVPEVALFQNVSAKIVKDERGALVSVVCGLVNTYGNGGFAGFQPFAYLADTSELMTVSGEITSERQQLIRMYCPETYGRP